MGKNLNPNVWGNDKGVYRDKENGNNAKTQLQFGEDGSIKQINRYEFNEKGEHNHAWYDLEDDYSGHRDKYKK